MSALIISKTVGDRQISCSRWDKLQSMWKEIEKKQQRNHRYDQKIQNFFDLFQAQLGSTEAELCMQKEIFADHLIGFIPKKNLNEPEVKTLIQWIEMQIQELDENPFRQNDIQGLRDKFHQAVTLHTKNQKNVIHIDQHMLDDIRLQVEQMMEEMLNETYFVHDDELTAFLKDPDAFVQFFKDKLSDETRQSTKNNQHENDDFQSDASVDDGKTTAKNDPLHHFFDSKMMTKLYRQLAQQFHPDKEIQVSKKDHKKQLMQELSQAKKEKDTFAMLSMAQKWLPDFELDLDKNALNSLEITMQLKIKTLNQQHRQMQNRDDLSGYLWQQFGGGSKAQQKQNLMNYHQQLTTNKQNLYAKCLSLKTVKAMRMELRQRMEEMRFFNLMHDVISGNEWKQ